MAAILAITTENMMLSKKPARIISFCGIKPEEKTIALGGVATGNIKAQEAQNAMTTTITTGGKFKSTATDINNGTSNAALAVLLTSSVKNITNKQTIINNNHV